MDKTCYFLQIPTEVMCMIVGYLSKDDKISFKFAYPHFFCQQRHINVREAFFCNQENIGEILRLHYNPDVVTKLDFNFCYWLSRKEISEFARSCNYLTELSVAYTPILVKDIAQVLCQNIKISKLALSICNPNSYWCVKYSVVEYLQWFQEGPIAEMSSDIFWQNLLSLSQLESAKEPLAQLKYLDLHIGQDPLILGTLLSACKNLESLCLKLNMEERKPDQEDLETENMTPRKEMNELLDILTLLNDECCSPVPPISLKSIVVLVHGRNKNLEGPMARFIQKIVEKSNSQLQCLWTAVPFLSVRDLSFNLNNMVAWKETKNYNNIILSPFKRFLSIESVACNKYMERGDFNLPQLKQIECGFWKDNFYQFCHAHPVLEKLRLNKRPCEVSELYSIVDWSRLPAVKVFSVHPRIIYTADYLRNFQMRERSLCVLLKKCKTLEELEIGPDFSESPYAVIRNLRETCLQSDFLCGLKLCTNLKKFSLNSVRISYEEGEIDDDSFLEEIATKCPNLESLKIQDLSIGLTNNDTGEGQTAVLESLYWSVIERCFLTLRSAKKLRVLRLKMRIVSKAYDKLIWLLIYCPSLIQLGLIATSVHCGLDMYSWDEATFTAFFVDLVRFLPKLIALLIVLPGVPASHCIAATAVLESTFRPVRPCFCVQITDSLESSNPPSLPWIHYQALACDPYGSVGEIPFHLNASDSNF